MTRRQRRWCGLIVAAFVLAGCSRLYLGDNPGPDVAKQTGPLTRPPVHAGAFADPH